MKKTTKIVFVFLFSFFFSHNSNAQIYSGMTYQSVIRSSGNAIVANTVVGVKISILQGTDSGTVVFSESHTPTTNANGLATFVIGEGIVLSGDFWSINWLNGPYFIKTETDPKGGTSYSISGTSQINSVPYSLFAENSNYATNSGDSWKRTGNTVDLTTDFIGSINDVDVAFKRNNANAGKIGFDNTYFGVGAGEFNTMGGNVAIGTNALKRGGGAGSTGNLNTAVGYDAYPNNVQGYGNAAFGCNSLLSNTHGFYNTAIGNAALQDLTTGDRNTSVGINSLTNLTTGNENIGIGNNTEVPTPTASNQLSIGNVIYGTAMGNTANGKIGIGVLVPTEKLEIAGKTKTTDLQVTAGAGANKVLTSDASGNATWQNTNANTGLETRLYTTQVIANNTNTRIIYNLESTDDANTHDINTGNWIIPSTGFYHIYATVMFTDFFPAGTYVKMLIYKNGGLFKSQTTVVGYTSANENFDITANLKLNANDTISIYVSQASGANATIGIVPASVYFSGYKVY